jgi:cytochrome P450
LRRRYRRLPRRAVRDFEFMGYRIPAGAGININPLYTHHMPQIWPDPERYDPLRFNAEASRARHKFAFVPFGGGAHMCLGLNFAYMQAKCFTLHFLKIPSRNRPRLSARLENVAHPLSARRPSRHLGTGLIPDADVASPIAR